MSSRPFLKTKGLCVLVVEANRHGVVSSVKGILCHGEWNEWIRDAVIIQSNIALGMHGFQAVRGNRIHENGTTCNQQHH